MARIYSTGFELNSTTSGVEADTFSSVTVSTTNVRSGTYAMRANAVASAPFWRTQVKTADDTTNICYLRFYLYIASATNAVVQIARIVDSGNVQQAVIRLTTGNQLQLCDNTVTQVGSNSSALSANTWYRVELKYNGSTHALEAQLEGVSFASGAGGVGSAGWSKVLLGTINGTPTADLYFDDVAINDSTGSFQNSYPGSEKLIALLPNAAGDVNTFALQTGGTAGSANNYTRVSEVTPDDGTTFNGSSTLNQEDLFNVTDSGIGASDTVNVVHIGVRFRNPLADTAAAIKLEVEKAASGTIGQSAAILPNSTTWRTNATAAPFNYPYTLYQDPDGSAWTQSTLDTMQIGYKLTTGPATGGRSVSVSKVWALVGYTPSVGGTSISKVATVPKASIGKVSGVTIASISKVAGVAN